MKKIKRIAKKKLYKKTHVNFSNSWPKSLDSKHLIWKNHEIQFSINYILKDAIRKQKLLTQKNF
jgi:hypothetical protein